MHTPSHRLVRRVRLHHIHLPLLVLSELVVTASYFQFQLLPCFFNYRGLFPPCNTRFERDGDASPRTRRLFEADDKLHDAKGEAVAGADGDEVGGWQQFVRGLMLLLLMLLLLLLLLLLMLMLLLLLLLLMLLLLLLHHSIRDIILSTSLKRRTGRSAAEIGESNQAIRS
jgi:hypothetical protein